ncbi:unnamed protein product [Euphydryas editha]|uniref:Uncharacterized protein n=1 Tax=Euphydryas editha TaxID=104508 RepID=A0AAU9VB22_EUPED|nr:unnamed protein product [Euphydryas editha]
MVRLRCGAKTSCKSERLALGTMYSLFTTSVYQTIEKWKTLPLLMACLVMVHARPEFVLDQPCHPPVFDGPVGMTLCRMEENVQDLKPAPGTYVEVVVVNRTRPYEPDPNWYWIVKLPPGYVSDEEKDYFLKSPSHAAHIQ